MANVPNQLPFLPGNVYADPTITRYHKTQILGLTNGIITGKCRCSHSPITVERCSSYLLLEKITAL